MYIYIALVSNILAINGLAERKKVYWKQEWAKDRFLGNAIIKMEKGALSMAVLLDKYNLTEHLTPTSTTTELCQLLILIHKQCWSSYSNQ